jgi:hypothetical protein
MTLPIPRHKLSGNQISLLEAVRLLEHPDREMITALCERSGFGEHGIRKQLGVLVRKGYLKSDLRYAQNTWSMQGLSRKRIAYWLSNEAYDFFNVPNPEKIQDRKDRYKLAQDHEQLGHKMMIAWFQTLGMVGHQRGLWDFDFRRGDGTMFKAFLDGKDRQQRPDGLGTFEGHKTFRRYLEAVHRARYARTAAHARKYLAALDDRRIDGRVVWLTHTTSEARNLRAALKEDFPGAGSLFIFLAQDMLSVSEPEKLLEATFMTTDGHGPVVPSRKPQAQVG